MKKSLVVVLIGLLLIAGLVMVSCGGKCRGGDGNCYVKANGDGHTSNLSEGYKECDLARCSVNKAEDDYPNAGEYSPKTTPHKEFHCDC